MTIWNKLQGWKQTIALVYWIITAPLIPMWFPHNELASNINLTIGIILSGIGMGSSFAKKYQEQINKNSEEKINKVGI